MTENDDILLKQFFDEYAVKQVPQGDFNKKVMRALPARRRNYMLWLFLAILFVVGLVYLQVPQLVASLAADAVTNIGVALYTLQISIKTLLSIALSIVACYYIFAREMLEESQKEPF